MFCFFGDFNQFLIENVFFFTSTRYTFTEQAGGDENGHARGAWDWSLTWKRIPLTKREKKLQKRITDPYKLVVVVVVMLKVLPWLFKITNKT